MTYVVVISGVRTRETARDYGQKTHFIYRIIIRVIKKKKDVKTTCGVEKISVSNNVRFRLCLITYLHVILEHYA